ncbi:uncharacterized protein LOC131937830 [Physella acuta]|uniref:uncharacterized protein LOC131937830 n=1 Tax=Physella acuta TaxID=109671 RepID=UPI0027DAD088|nr:uncharacterized protein LOC131937830 [Physella acuta]
MERTSDLSLRCDVSEVGADDELVRVMWFYTDRPHGGYVEIFSADLTSDSPSYLFSSRWTGRAVFEPAGIGNIRLPAAHVTKEFAGDYRCQVNSLMSSGYSDVSIDVLYGPGTSIVITPGGRVERQEKEDLALSCSAQCNPACTYRWYKAGRKLAGQAVLEMTSLSRQNAGLYACQARNEVGRSIKPVELRVFFPATIVAMNVTGEGDWNTAHNVSSTRHNLLLTCEVQGWPEVTVQWLKNGVHPLNTSATLQADVNHRLSSFEIRSATCLDSGEYSCKAWNGVGESSAKTAILDMGCAPFEISHLSSCQTGPEVEMIKSLNDIAKLQVCMASNPSPVVRLEHSGKKIMQDVEVTCDGKRCVAVLELNLTSPDDYGEYLAHVSNIHGVWEKTFRLVSRPWPPPDLKLLNVSQGAACFRWRPGFNGGATQTFSLRYRAMPPRDSDKVKVKENGVVTVEENDDVIKESGEYTACVDDLDPYVEYEVTLTSSNKFGVSEASKLLRFQTLRDVRVSPPRPPAHDRSLDLLADAANIILKTTRTTASADIPRVMSTPPTTTDDDEDDDDEPPEDESEDLLKLFGPFLTIDQLKAVNGSAGAHQFSNYSHNLQRLLTNVARAQDHAPNSLGQFNLPSPTRPGRRHSHVTTSLVTTSVADADPISGFVTSVTVSVTAVATLFIIGIVIALTCMTYVRRKRRLQRCQERYRHRMKLNKFPIRAVAFPVLRSQFPNRRTLAPEVKLDDQHKLSSFTCACKDSALLTSLPSLRPRLSSPDMRASRAESGSPSTSAQSSPGPDLPGPDDSRISCPSYTDLYPSQGTQKKISAVERLPQTTYSCLHQTDLKQINENDAYESTKYLDLYETLSSRSRSRSPSNVYDPLDFECETSVQRPVSDVSLVANPKVKAKKNEGKSRLRRHNARDLPLRRPKFKELGKANGKANGKKAPKAQSGRLVDLKALRFRRGSPASGSRVVPELELPSRAPCYANAIAVQQLAGRHSYANIQLDQEPVLMRLSAGSNRAVSGDRRGSRTGSMQEPFYTDIDSCLHEKLYMDMKTKYNPLFGISNTAELFSSSDSLCTRGPENSGLSSKYAPSVITKGSVKSCGVDYNYGYNDYLVPFVRLDAMKKVRGARGSVKDGKPPPPQRGSSTKRTSDSVYSNQMVANLATRHSATVQGDAGSRRSEVAMVGQRVNRWSDVGQGGPQRPKSSVAAYMVTDCVKLSGTGDAASTDASHDSVAHNELANIYDDVIMPYTV